MSGDDKLQALLRSCEAQEQSAARDFSRLQDVLRQREQHLSGLAEELTGLKLKLQDMQRERIFGGSASGTCSSVSTITSYTKRLTAQIEKLEDSIRASKQDVSRAAERCDAAEEELIEARIEKKKIERLISGRQDVQRATETAREEVSLDDMLNRKPRK